MKDKQRILKQYFKTEKATLTSAYKKSVNRRLVKIIDGFAGDIAGIHLGSSDSVNNFLADLNNPGSDAFEVYLDGVERAIADAARISAKERT